MDEINVLKCKHLDFNVFNLRKIYLVFFLWYFGLVYNFTLFINTKHFIHSILQNNVCKYHVINLRKFSQGNVADYAMVIYL